MADEATVKLRLDTRQAKGDLRQLTKEADKTSGRIGGGIRRAVGKGMGAVGLGGGIGAGLAAVRGATSSGLGDVVGESFVQLGAQLNEFFLGDMDDKARSIRQARESLKEAFGYQTGIHSRIPPGAENFFNQRVTEGMTLEHGKHLIETDKRFMGPPVEANVDVNNRISDTHTVI